MALCPLYQGDVCVLKTENTEIDAKPLAKEQKSTKMHSPSRIVPIIFMFFKNVFPNGFYNEKPPEKLDNAFLRLYLCSVENES